MKSQKYSIDLDKVYYWLTIFILTGILLFLVMPGKPKFQFEYQKGFPWRHKNLIAPFDFAILKSGSEIDAEKKVQLINVSPYFTTDTTILIKKTEKLKNDLNISEFSINYESNPVPGLIFEKLKELYNTGILLHSPDSYKELQGKEIIGKRAGNTVVKTEIKSLYTEKTAYNELKNYIEQLKKGKPEIKKVLDGIAPENYISSNLTFDKETSKKEEDEVLRNISVSRGMVQSGERILLEGEIIDDAKFQVLESLKASYENEKNKGIQSFTASFGQLMFIFILLGLVFAFLFNYRRDVLNHVNKLVFLMSFMVLTVFISSIINSIPGLHIYIFPLAIFPIVVRNFFDSRTAIFTLIITAILIAFYAPNNYEYILLQFSAGVVAVFSLNHMHRRVHVVIATLWIFATYVAVYTALNLIHDDKIDLTNWQMLERFAISSILILLVYPLVYIFEKLFGFVSDVTLIELSDTNQPLLRKLAEEAPGTFQHSMQIAILAEEVILKIGGNPFLVRAGALYHDIGKIARPDFFIENQAYGMNPHDKLDHLRSAEIIINHVENGERMARKFKLPDSLVEFIITHHGTTKTRFFLVKHQQENPELNINENQFKYPGPLPRSKEATVVMLVDGIEAASRALKEKTADNLRELINRMIDQKISDKQLEQSELSFKDINTIKDTLLTKLINIYHVRIEYPKEVNS